MFSVLLKSNFYLNKKKWIIAYGILLLSVIILKYIHMDDLQTNNLLFWDYAFKSLSYPALILYIVPIIYIFLIGDLISRDYEDGLILNYLVRSKYRASYIFYKVSIIAISSLVLIFMLISSLIIVGLFSSMSLVGQSNYYLVDGARSSNQGISLLGVIQTSLIFLGLTSIGVICVVVSLLFIKFKLQFVVILVLVFQGHQSYFVNRGNIKYSLTGQMVLDIHNPFIFFDNRIEDVFFPDSVSVLYSYFVYICLIVLFMILGNMFFARSNISRE